MNKQEFLTELREGLSGLPQDDIEERLAFYGEMLDDRIEEGLSEDAAVAEIGDADEIVRQTVADIPFAKLAKERIKPKRRLKAWEIILLALGSPVWLSILIAAAAVINEIIAVVAAKKGFELAGEFGNVKQTETGDQSLRGGGRIQ